MSDIKLKNSLSQMKGRSFSSNRKPNLRKGRGGIVQYNIPLQDKIRIQRAMQEELRYYNYLVETISPLLRTMPEVFIKFDKQYSMFAGEFSISGLTIDDVVKKNIEIFQKYKNIIDKGLDNSTKFVLNSLTGKYEFSNHTRKAMTIEFFKFCYLQAQGYLNILPSEQHDNQIFKHTLTSLQTYDINQKRHVQIPRFGMTVVWSEELEMSAIKIPYASKGWSIPRMNLKKEDWSVLIIHQEPGQIVNSTDNWLLDFRKDDSYYLLQYLEMLDPRKGTGFFKS